MKPNLNSAPEHDWIPWKGGRCPVHPETTVRAWMKSVGECKHSYPAKNLDWGKRIEDGARLPGSILGYRVISEGGE